MIGRGLAMALVLCGCGASFAGPVEATGESFATPEAEAARERAPDMYAAAARARDEAEAAQARGDLAAAQDHATRARLLLGAAVAEADRVRIEEQRIGLEAQASELEEQAARDAHARLELEAEMGRRASARMAAREAALAFEQAASDEERRYRAREPERARMHAEAASILLRRAQLLLSAAQALGADGPRVTAVTDGIEEAERTSHPARRLQMAQDAIRGALAALGEARAARDGPTRDETRALVEQAEELGLRVEQRDRGLVVVVDDVFGRTGAQPRPAARRRLQQVAALVQAHPHGPLQVHAFASGRTARRVADARAQAAVTQLAQHGATRDRLHPEGIVDGALDDTDQVELVFVAYGARDVHVAPGAGE